jgi:hypothetical protein
MKNTLKITKVLSASGIIVGAFFLSAFASTFTAPTNSPPGDNTPVPLNVGSTPQSRSGSLQINSNFAVAGKYLQVVKNFMYSVGTPGVGKILTSIDSNGTAQWSTALGATENSQNKYIVQSPTKPISDATCPDGYALVGFNLYDAGSGAYSYLGSLYCQKILP